MSKLHEPSPIPGTYEAGFIRQPIYHDYAGTKLMRDLVRKQTGFDNDRLNVYTMGECTIIVAQEPAGLNGELLWHLSVSRVDRHPSWDEIKVARYKLMPTNICVGMLLPPPQYYVNVQAQDHVFHAWEITDPREPWTGR